MGEGGGVGPGAWGRGLGGWGVGVTLAMKGQYGPYCHFLALSWLSRLSCPFFGRVALWISSYLTEDAAAK